MDLGNFARNHNRVKPKKNIDKKEKEIKRE